MYNTYDTMAVCEPKVPAESMNNVIGETRDLTIKMYDLAFDIRSQLFGATNSSAKNEHSINCAYDVCLDIRENVMDTIRILDEIRGRIIGQNL